MILNTISKMRYLPQSPIPVSQITKRDRSTVVIGDTIFVDGSPHNVCTVCGMPVRQYDMKKVTILRYWHREDVLGNVKLENGNLVQQVETKYRPILYSAPSCFDCWNSQDLQRQSFQYLMRQDLRKSDLVYYE